MKTDTLLVEVRTEELPPPAVRVLAEKFPHELLNRLREGGLTESQTPRNGMFATPRRFAALIDGVQERAQDRKVTRRGPQVKDGLDTAGKPSPALRGFMRAVGISDVTELAREKEKGREYFVWHGEKPGAALADVLPQMVTDSMCAIPDFPSMTWGAHDYAFVRPVRGLVMMLGNKVIPGEVMGAKSGRITRGHPALAAKSVTINNAANYESALKDNSVIVDYRERAKTLNDILEDASHKEHCADDVPDIDEDKQTFKLKEEVVAMCEKPSGHVCTVGEEFWDLPQDYVASCLIKHQRCFPLLAGAMQLKFLFIADTPEYSKKIANGAIAVVHARLRDLAFYLQTDKKLTEKEAREKLDGIVYHRKLGSQSARAKRVAVIADSVGKIMKLNPNESAKLKRAAAVCKLDLPTMVVGEYPELAGRMAAHYFCGKEPEVASIVDRHSNDDFGLYILSSWQPSAVALFLADKLEKIVGMFLAGEKPAGRRDPHGLRRAAAQMTKMLAPKNWDASVSLSRESADITKKLSLSALLVAARDAFPADLAPTNFDIHEAREFIARRAPMPDNSDAEALSSVYALQPDFVAEIKPRYEALQTFLQREESSTLIAANKRINNILRKSDAPENPPFSEELLQEPMEKRLHKCVVNLEKKTQQLMAKGDYQKVLTILAMDAAKPISGFFDKIMVNTDNHELRANRLALLIRLRAQLNRVADISHLSVRK